MHTERKNIIKSTYTVVFLIVFLFFPIAVTFGAAVQNTNPTGDQSPTLSGNTEVGEVVWVNNVLQVRTRAAGTGTLRSVQLTTGTSNTGVVVNSSGNVGIGTTLPNQRLEISAAAGTDGSTAPTLRITNAQDIDYILGSSIGAIEFYSNEQSGIAYPGVAGAIKSIVENTSGHQTGLAFYTTNVDISATERLRIAAGGNIGIGNTAPTEKLEVTGNIKASGNIIAGGTMTANVGASNVSSGVFGTIAGKGNYAFEAAANTNNVLKIDATNERVGIGTGSPDSPLHISGPSQVTNLHAVHTWDGGADAQTMVKLETTRTANGGTSPQIFFKDNYTGGYNWKIGGDDTGVDFSILKAPVGTFPNTYVMKFQGSTGNVGIGTTSPLSLLHLSKSSDDILRITNTTANRTWRVGVSNTGLFQFTDLTAGVDRITTDTSGNVGIGTTSPSYKLDVSGGMRVSSGAATAGTFISTADAQIGLSSSDSWAGIGFADSGAVDDYIWFNGGAGTFAIGGGGANVTNKKLHVDGGMTVGSNYDGTAVGTNSLVVEGNISAGGTITANVSAPNVSAGTFGTTAGKGNYTFEAAANTNSVLKIDATNERVGIGTASPGYKLDVYSGSGSVPNVFHIGEGSATHGIYLTPYGSGHLFNSITTGNAEDLYLQTGGIASPSTGIVLKHTSGNVGIGTVAPTNKLQIGTLATYAGNDFTIGDGTGQFAIDQTSAVTNFYSNNNFAFLSASGGDGRIGIGITSPGAKLDVQDAGISGWKSLIIAKSSNSPAKVDIGVSSNEGMIQLYTSGGVVGTQIASHPAHTTYFNAGNVGIGITSPVSRLHSYNSTADTVTGRTNIIDVLTLETTNTAAQPYRGFGQGIEFRGKTYQNSTVRTLGRIATVLTDDSTTNTGTAIVFQNVADSATATAPVERMRIDYNGTVGIGTATPGSTYKLDVAGSARFSSPIEVGSPTAVNHATTKSYVDSILGTGGSGTSTASFATMYVSGTSTLAATTGKVIIGGAGPSLKLDVIGQGQFTDTISATKYYDYNDPTYYIDPANTGTSLKFAGAVQSDGTGINYMNGQLAVGTTNPGTYRLYVAGTSWFNNQVTINGNLIMNASSSITMSGGNIGSIGKITVQTIDPLYEIDGKKYATYAPSIAGGVKEEFVGRGNLQPTTYNLQQGNGEEKISNLAYRQAGDESIGDNSKFKIQNSKLSNYTYIIDFSKIEKGSDLWLWYQAVDFNRDNVEVTATAYGIPVAIAYEIEGKKIIFKTYNPQPTTHNGGGETYDEGIEFSYRLIGNRHDWKEWPTYSKDQKETPSFILKSK